MLRKLGNGLKKHAFGIVTTMVIVLIASVCATILVSTIQSQQRHDAYKQQTSKSVTGTIMNIVPGTGSLGTEPGVKDVEFKPDDQTATIIDKCWREELCKFLKQGDHVTVTTFQKEEGGKFYLENWRRA